MRWLAGLFLVAHGLVHVAIWVPPAQKDAPFDAQHSPMFGDVRGAAIALALVAGTAFVVSGICYLAGQDWWAPVAAVAGGTSSVLSRKVGLARPPAIVFLHGSGTVARAGSGAAAAALPVAKGETGDESGTSAPGTAEPEGVNCRVSNIDSRSSARHRAARR